MADDSDVFELISGGAEKFWYSFLSFAQSVSSLTCPVELEELDPEEELESEFALSLGAYANRQSEPEQRGTSPVTYTVAHGAHEEGTIPNMEQEGEFLEAIYSEAPETHDIYNEAQESDFSEWREIYTEAEEDRRFSDVFQMYDNPLFEEEETEDVHSRSLPSRQTPREEPVQEQTVEDRRQKLQVQTAEDRPMSRSHKSQVKRRKFLPLNGSSLSQACGRLTKSAERKRGPAKFGSRRASSIYKAAKAEKVEGETENKRKVTQQKKWKFLRLVHNFNSYSFDLDLLS